MRAKFVNPYTDYGFKKIFGEEASKHLLIDFLNTLLPSYHQIADLTFKNTEQLGLTDFDRKAIYDIYCENEKGEKFIVELQRAKQAFFKERTIYYATFPIVEQAEKGEWNYHLKAVYCIGILDFTFHETKQEVVHTVKLKDQNNQVFYDKLTFIYIEMPNFVKTEKELGNQQDKWLYFIKNLEDIQNIPKIFHDDMVFQQAFDKAELANFNRQELDQYEKSLKTYRDLKNSIDTAFDDGFDEGFGEGFGEGLDKGKQIGQFDERLNIARKAKTMGMSLVDIAKLTKLSEDDIQGL